MFATRWHWAWGGSPFFVWSRWGWSAKVLGSGRAAIRTLRLGEREHEVRAVRAEISKGWLVHRVGLRVDADKVLWIARRLEVGPMIDVTYDGANLLADVAWAGSLGSALAAVLQVPFEANDSALHRGMREERGPYR
jgi:hypothetical protein